MVYYISPRVRSMPRSWMGAFPEFQNRAEDCGSSIPVDIRSTDEGYEIRAVAAGVFADDLEIQFTRDTVTIKGEFKSERTEEDRYLRSELPEGKFSREISFSEPVNADKADASLKDGILTLFIPKAEEAKPRSIKVKAE